MNFRAPLPFLEAIESREVRSVLPTEFRTKMLQEIPAPLRERAMFSAGVTNVEFLQEASTAVDDLISGNVDRATKRAEMKKLVAKLELRPEPGKEDSIEDLGSDARLNLILDHNVAAAQGYGAWKQGQDPEILDNWPAQELVRVIDSKEKRDWNARWVAAGGPRTSAWPRMIALKNDPIWTRISRFGLPYAPFDWNSGMDLEDRTRDEAIALGLIDRDTELLPQDRGFNDNLQASPEVRDQELRDALLERFAGVAEFVGGVFRLVKGGG